MKLTDSDLSPAFRWTAMAAFTVRSGERGSRWAVPALKGNLTIPVCLP